MQWLSRQPRALKEANRSLGSDYVLSWWQIPGAGASGSDHRSGSGFGFDVGTDQSHDLLDDLNEREVCGINDLSDPGSQ